MDTTTTQAVAPKAAPETPMCDTLRARVSLIKGRVIKENADFEECAKTNLSYAVVRFGKDVIRNGYWLSEALQIENALTLNPNAEAELMPWIESERKRTERALLTSNRGHHNSTCMMRNLENQEQQEFLIEWYRWLGDAIDALTSVREMHERLANR